MGTVHFFTVEDVLADERFLAWASGDSDSAGANWIRQLYEDQPNDRFLIEEALIIYRQLLISEPPVLDTEEQADRLIKTVERVKQRKGAFILGRSVYMWAAAASIVMVLSVSVFLIMGKNKPKLTIAGSPTQQLHILSDGTTVALKENSTVTYDPLLENKKTREVWLKGSAEFNVKHKPDNKSFVVHTDWFDIEVTGTSFSAINNSDQASVLLIEGGISLLLHNGSRVNMKPGDFYEAKNSSNTSVGREEISLEKKIVFDNLPFEEVARMVEERYGIKIEITSATLSKRRITGALPNDNLDVLIGALEVATDCQIVKRTNLLIINEAN